MTVKNLGIIGGGQLGSMLSTAAKKLNIKTVIFSDDIDAPAQNFATNLYMVNIMMNQRYKNFLQRLMLLHMSLKIFLIKL